MRLRRLSILGLVAALTLGATAGPSPGLAAGRAAAAPIQITMMSGWPLNQARGVVLQGLVNQYNKLNAGKVKVTVDINPDWPALQQQIRTMISAGRAPDIFQYNFNPNDLSMQKSGQLLDFTPYMNAAWKARFNPHDLATLTIGGKLLSIPFEADGVGFYYNKALFKKAGIGAFPTTWDQFFSDCGRFKKVGVAAISLQTQDDAWLGTNILSYLAIGLGGPSAYFGRSLDTPTMVRAATLMKQVFACSTADAMGANYDVASNDFLLGRTAMIADGPWAIGPIEKQFKGAAQIGLAPAPTFASGAGKPGDLVTDAQSPFAAGKQSSPRKAAAIANFLEFLTSPGSVKQLTLQGKLLLSPKLQLTAGDQQGADPLLVHLISLYEQAPRRVVEMTRILKPAGEAKLPSLLQGLALGSLTPAQFVQQLQASNH
ncbi:MAG TPA: ABC transporter substrate-binding protein [Chloroflexota bacterium]|nr:ABC transporter substrate-binding protein [Chloroflexota bacterium]